MNDYVAYHSTERRQRPFSPTEDFNFFSRKPKKSLLDAVGHRVWTVVGERMGSRQTYRLAGMFVPAQVRPDEDEDGFRITGRGTPLRPQPELTDLAWFQKLLLEQNQFSYGFNRIRNPDTVAELEQLLHRKAKGHPTPGASPSTSARTTDKAAPAALAQAAEAAERRGDFDVTDLADARQRVIAAIVRRQGQPAFRKALLGIYGGCCAFSGCRVPDVLDAAHILPYNGPATNHPQNGLLLRTDLHTLFDLGLLTVDTGNMTIITAPSLDGTEYADLAGRRIPVPKDSTVAPSRAALDAHRRRAV